MITFLIILFHYLFISFFIIIIDILRQRTHDIEVKKYCITLLEKLGSFEYTRQVLESLDKEARAEVYITIIMNIKNLWILLKYLSLVVPPFRYRLNVWAVIPTLTCYLTNCYHGNIPKIILIVYPPRVMPNLDVINNQRGKEEGIDTNFE